MAPSSASSQRLVIDEDTAGTLVGCRRSVWKSVLFGLCCVLSGGLLLLFYFWVPSLRAIFTCTTCALEKATHVVIIIPLKLARGKPRFGFTPTVSGFHRVTVRSSHGHQEGDYRAFAFRQLRYFYNRDKGEFIESKDVFNSTCDFDEQGVLRTLEKGLDSKQLELRRAIFDRNLIDIGEQSVFRVFFEHIVHPFYVFQVFSVLVWYNQYYYYFATCIVITSSISLIVSLIDTMRNHRDLQNMARYICGIHVLREGNWIHVNSDELVPGDIVDISDFTPEGEHKKEKIPFDGLLLSGSLITNESMLTGESIPVPKVPFRVEAGKDLQTTLRSKKHLLHSGTSVIRAKVDQEKRTLAVVTTTGFYTAKGMLVRSILFPKPNEFSFTRDSFIFILVLCLLALIGYFYGIEGIIATADPGGVVLSLCEIITIAIPPSLPAALSIGSVIAISRLRKRKLFCISPPKINVAGKLNLICFDKTGTLTEEGLDVLGVSIPEEGGFSPALDQLSDISKKQPIAVRTMAACHSLKDINGKPLGDPLDIKMFEFTKFHLKEMTLEGKGEGAQASEVTDVFQLSEETKEKTAYLRILKTFEFDPALQRMSTVIQDLSGSGGYEVHLKGAPETVAQLCDSATVPATFAEGLSRFTSKGYRVIGLASKSVSKEECTSVEDYGRAEAEQGLTFRGLLILENCLKPETKGALELLHNAGFKTVMVTGDNILTAVNVGRKCDFIQPTFSVYMCKSQTDSEEAHSSLSPDTKEIDEFGAKWVLLSKASEGSSDDYRLSMTGSDYLHFRATLNQENFKKLMLKSSIFARMTPELKKGLVEELMALHYSVGMCGDGANDCGSLRTADVGLSLAETEASVAAPFSSKIQNIDAMVNLVRHGRSALVTSLNCFKYMAIYGMIQATSAVVLRHIGSNLGDYQYLWQDMFLVLPFGAAMAFMKPRHSLTDNKPISNLISKPVILSILGHILLQGLAQGIALGQLKQQPWFSPLVPEDDSDNYICQENSTIFLVSAYLYINAALFFSLETKFQKPFYKNPWFMALMVYAYAFAIYMNFAVHDWILTVMVLVPDLPSYWRGVLCALGFAHLIVGLLWEMVGLPALVRFLTWVEEKIRGRPRLQRDYEKLQEGVPLKVRQEGGKDKALLSSPTTDNSIGVGA